MQVRPIRQHRSFRSGDQPRHDEPSLNANASTGEDPFRGVYFYYNGGSRPRAKTRASPPVKPEKNIQSKRDYLARELGMYYPVAEPPNTGYPQAQCKEVSLKASRRDSFFPKLQPHQGTTSSAALDSPLKKGYSMFTRATHLFHLSEKIESKRRRLALHLDKVSRS